ncbi:MAG: asparaginase [Bdellovibrionales bacterium CG12_big_fil_rev_8_21_14_0_65_38_15]|nr:MAG: asparaginase [Bdellovibrionales bacterium CG22_combo_CG10-13_8_21_14_all_38_13]PIQ54095.1 MAG: asparaginase [Bdellovibrionales bacterium CG12_big_fil_rev_8_21_14_0_65_38_15]PIR28620.1 MAG: asparaginase [Bdellovibrionales bacterium CG11_big_fil_rev_8_21_14_0_20_38_13]
MSNRAQDIVVITTGGTIEKTYDESDGSLANRESVIKARIMSRLRLPYTGLQVFSVMSKDSLFMTDDDRSLLIQFIKAQLEKNIPIVILHGTDTMAISAERCFQDIKDPKVPIVFTGAMKPLGFEDSDALQNVTEALLASKLVSPGIYLSFHGRVFKVPGVKKNRDRGTFEQVE